MCQKAQKHLKLDEAWLADTVQRIDELHEFNKSKSEQRAQYYAEQKEVYRHAQKQRDLSKNEKHSEAPGPEGARAISYAVRLVRGYPIRRYQR